MNSRPESPSLIINIRKDKIQWSRRDSDMIYRLAQQPAAVLARSKCNVVLQQELGRQCPDFHPCDYLR